MKKYGIRITLPPGDVMSAPHLLGPDFEAFRWYESRIERDEAYRSMQNPPDYYRIGDSPTQVLSKIDPEPASA
ncbi:MAG: hypothetical protein ISN28_08720 [Ectothiorhodospiraceae bacterium AqS1]|nr:hypothetical protein [Ectothiorhodospiraceae bacterium AqS1]